MFFSNLRNSRRKKDRMELNTKRIPLEEKGETSFFSAKKFKTALSSYSLSATPSLDSQIIKKWNFTPIRVEHLEGNTTIRFQSINERDSRKYFFESLKETHCLFQDTKEMILPALIDLTTMDDVTEDEVVISLPTDQFNSMQILNYTRYLTSFVEEEVNRKCSPSYLPQYPFLFRMYNGCGDVLENQKMICFLKIAREWVIYGLKDSTNDSILHTKMDQRLKEETSREQLMLVKNLHKILDVIFSFHHGDASAFCRFFQPDAIGMVIVYHFLFMDLIDRIHWKLVEELDEFFKVFGRQEHMPIAHGLRSRHLSLVTSLHRLKSLPVSKDGYIIFDDTLSRYDINSTAVKFQLYSLLCDPQMDCQVAMVVMSYINSRTILNDRVKQMEAFASEIQTPFNKGVIDNELRKISLDVTFKIDTPMCSSEIQTLGQAILSSKKQKSKTSKKHLMKSSNMKDSDVIFDPFLYLKMLKTTPVEQNILHAPSTRIEPEYEAPFSFFIRELEKIIVMKSKYSPQLILWKDCNNPKIQFPLRLTSQKTCSYMDDVYLSRY
jgi:hypothetical protein